jgi:hypothetical protein
MTYKYNLAIQRRKIPLWIKGRSAESLRHIPHYWKAHFELDMKFEKLKIYSLEVQPERSFILFGCSFETQFKNGRRNVAGKHHAVALAKYSVMTSSGSKAASARHIYFIRHTSWCYHF